MTIHHCCEDPFLKVWANIFANRFEIDSNFWENVDRMFVSRFSNPDDSPLLLGPFLKVWANISVKDFGIDSKFLEKIDGMFT